MSEQLQHAELLQPRPGPAWVTLDQAREAARQLAGDDAAVVHQFLGQHNLEHPSHPSHAYRQAAERLAVELWYSIEVLASCHPDAALEDFAWFRDGHEAIDAFYTVANQLALPADEKMTEPTSWEPISTAPLDRMVMLYRPTAPWPFIKIAPGMYRGDSFARRIKPYWAILLFGFNKVSDARLYEPTHWYDYLPLKQRIQP